MNVKRDCMLKVNDNHKAQGGGTEDSQALQEVALLF